MSKPHISVAKVGVSHTIWKHGINMVDQAIDDLTENPESFYLETQMPDRKNKKPTSCVSLQDMKSQLRQGCAKTS